MVVNCAYEIRPVLSRALVCGFEFFLLSRGLCCLVIDWRCGWIIWIFFIFNLLSSPVVWLL